MKATAGGSVNCEQRIVRKLGSKKEREVLCAKMV